MSRFDRFLRKLDTVSLAGTEIPLANLRDSVGPVRLFRLVASLAAVALLTVVSGVQQLVRSWFQAAARLATAPVAFATSLFSEALAPTPVLAAWEAMAAGLAEFGLGFLQFPLAVGISLAALWVGVTVLRRGLGVVSE
jgi:hypothetical protein